jgi:hypothetical protein
MGVDNAKSIIDGLEEGHAVADKVHGEPRHGTAESTDDKGTPASDETLLMLVYIS